VLFGHQSVAATDTAQHNTFDLPSRKSLLRSVLSDIATFDRPLHAACLICYVTSPRQKKAGPIDAIQPQASAAVLTEPNEAGLLFISLISKCGFKLRNRMQSFRSVDFLVMPCEQVDGAVREQCMQLV
jgi:hypothetical protein